MTYTITQWRYCVTLLKADPNMSYDLLNSILNIDRSTLKNLVYDVVEIWKIDRKFEVTKPRKVKFIRTAREKEEFVK